MQLDQRYQRNCWYVLVTGVHCQYPGTRYCRVGTREYLELRNSPYLVPGTRVQSGNRCIRCSMSVLLWALLFSVPFCSSSSFVVRIALGATSIYIMFLIYFLAQKMPQKPQNTISALCLEKSAKIAQRLLQIYASLLTPS